MVFQKIFIGKQTPWLNVEKDKERSAQINKLVCTNHLPLESLVPIR